MLEIHSYNINDIAVGHFKGQKETQQPGAHAS